MSNQSGRRWPSVLVPGEVPRVDVYLDERGVPGQDNLFVVSGIVVFQDHDGLSQRWLEHREERDYPSKGTRFSEEQLLDTVAFLSRESVLPTCVYSESSDCELKEWKALSKEYERSSSPAKVAKKSPPATGMWVSHVTMAVAPVSVQIAANVGRIQAATLHVDKFSMRPELRARFEEEFDERLGRDLISHLLNGVRGTPFEASGLPDFIRERFSSPVWETNYRSRGPLSDLADVVCAMAGKGLDGTSGAWDLLCTNFDREGFSLGQGFRVDVSEEIQKSLVKYRAVVRGS